METYWKEGTNSVYYLEPANPINRRNVGFIGAYGNRTHTVYAGNGSSIGILPSDLILDEALAAAKTIIMLNMKVEVQL